MAESGFRPNATAADVKIDDIFGWEGLERGGRGMRNLDRVRTYFNGRVLSFEDVTRSGVTSRIFHIADFSGNRKYVSHRINAKVEIQDVPAAVRAICYQ